MESIVIIGVAIILIIAAFFIGRSQVKPIEDNNKKIIQDNQVLTERKIQLEKEVAELNTLKQAQIQEKRLQLNQLDSDIS